MHLQSEYHNEFETTKLQQQPGKVNGFGPNNNYRSSFTAYPNTNRTHHQLNQSVIGPPSFRDTHSFYPASNDVYPSQLTSPIQSHMQPYDHPHNSFDFGGAQAGLVGAHKPYMDNYNPNAASVLSHHATVKTNGPLPQQSGPPKFNGGSQYGNPVQLTSQTPYGPHLAAGGMNGGGNVVPQTNIPNASNISSSNVATTSSHEEISTIFVVGFPEDMQEREFQNMFTFSPGFEAATLKIPNKEYTAYGANPLRGYQGYNGSNDPYNLVTVNQGGVVVDGGRDGTMSSWPAAVSGDDGTGIHFGGGAGNIAPRKQIIGFAKFKSRDAAQEARDVLQGRRVDIEKGAVLKAEMAKKNLHTKRGVGPVPGPAPPASLNPPNTLPPVPHLNGGGLVHPTDPFTIQNDPYGPRERELPLGGIDLGRLGTWRDQLQRDVHAVTNGLGSAHTAEFHPRKDREEEEQRRRDREREVNMYSAMGFGAAVGPTTVTRGPRERAEDEERDRRRKEKEARLRASNSTAFDAFHSVPAGNAPTLSRQNSSINGVNGASLLAPSMDTGSSLGSSPLLANAFAVGHNPIGQQPGSLPKNVDEAVGPWDKVPSTANGVARPHSSSQRSISPEDIQDFRHSPPDEGSLYGGTESQGRQQRTHSDSSASSVISAGVIGTSSSASGPDSSTEADLTQAMTELMLNTDNGSTSPQLPSPSSGVSSTSTRNAIDQNPPINTLYVGNLPAPSPSIGFSHDHLEESLRQLFMSQPGYRRLCFRQKNNGPMCFVEFEDVSYATKALNELYGHTLNGLVKGGGIRLSYSKNPLGVRTPTSATSVSGSLQQQQAMQSLTFPPDQFQSRVGDDLPQPQPSHILRRDTGAYGNSFLTSPPPRFTSPPTNPFGQPSLPNAPNSFSLRTNGGSLSSLYSYSIVAGGGLGGHPSSTTFSPFGISSPPSIPEQNSSSEDPSALHSSQHFTHRTLPTPVNIEATRAG